MRSQLLVEETGLGFGRWRRQLHIVLAIQSLARGESGQVVASNFGYESAKSFVTMFEKGARKVAREYTAELGTSNGA